MLYHLTNPAIRICDREYKQIVVNKQEFSMLYFHICHLFLIFLLGYLLATLP